MVETVVSGALLDFDRDGRLDVVRGSNYMTGGGPLECFPLRLYRNLGEGRFEEVTEKAGLGARVPAADRSAPPAAASAASH